VAHIETVLIVVYGGVGLVLLQASSTVACGFPSRPCVARITVSTLALSAGVVEPGLPWEKTC
jgi:hypothetical protein